MAVVLLSMSLFSIMDGMSKTLVAEYSPIEILGGRYLAILVLLSPFILRAPGRALRTAHPRLQILRGLCALGSALFFVASLGMLPMAEATAITFVSPLLMTAMSIPLLGERIGPRRWSAVAVGFLGALVVIRPGTDAIGTAAIYPLASAACWALSLVITRRMRRGDAALTTIFYSTCVGLAACAVALPAVWRTPTIAACAIVGLTAMLSTLGQYLLIFGLMRGSISLVAPFTYSQMVWSTLVGAFVFGTVPSAWTWLGASLIIGSGIYVAHRERVTRQRGAG
jgi:drug/metabolite transporter (DMT)-like permease